MIKKLRHLTYVTEHRILNGNKVSSSKYMNVFSKMVNIYAKPLYKLQIFALAEFPVQ